MSELSIGDLATRTGLSTRNIRLYQTRGMIDPPEKRGRAAVYTEAHVERLELIQRLLADGMTRDLVQRVLRAEDPAMPQLLSLREAATHPSGVQMRAAETVTWAELRDRVGIDRQALERAVAMDLVRPQGDDTYALPIPELLDIAEQAVGLGIPLSAVLEIAAFATSQVDAASQFFVDVIRREVWEPFDAAGRPDDRWGQLAAALDQPHALPARIYEALFARALVDASRRVTTEVLDQQTRG